jgi:hypothetical protein
MNYKSETHTATNGARVEVGTVTFEGRDFSALGSIVDPARGVAVGYVSRDKATGAYTFTTWEGKTIAPLAHRGTWTQRGFYGVRITIYAWTCTIDGRRYSGRNSGPCMLLRMRAGGSP